MADLFEETPAADQFCRSVEADIQRYKLFPQERFKKIVSGVIATSGVDSQGEAINPIGLLQILKQIRSRPFWGGVHHDPLTPYVSRVVAADLFRSPDSQQFFLAGVVVFLDPFDAQTFESSGMNLAEVNPLDVTLDDRAGAIRIAFSPHEVDPTLIEEALTEAPEAISREPQRAIRKGIGAISIVHLAVPLIAVAAYQFVKSAAGAAGKEVGEFGGQVLVEVMEWMRTKLRKVLRSTASRRSPVLLLLSLELPQCHIKFVLEYGETESDYDKAVESLPVGIETALTVARQVDSLTVLVMRFSPESGSWHPLHGVSNTLGVIVNKPTHVDLDSLVGFSVEGYATARPPTGRSEATKPEE